MPYINTTTTAKITEESKRALTEALGKAIELIPGKSEDWLMLSFKGDAEMAFRGDIDKDCAMVEVEIFGKAKRGDLDSLTARICKITEDILGVPSDRIYVKYREVDVWGYNGFNF